MSARDHDSRRPGAPVTNWRPPADFAAPERVPPGATHSAGSGTFSELENTESPEAAAAAASSGTWRRPDDLMAPAAAARPAAAHRLESVDLERLIAGGLAQGARVRVAATASSFVVALPGEQVHTVLRSFSSALNSELPLGAELIAQASPVELRDLAHASRLGLQPGAYLFLNLAMVTSGSAADTGTFIRITETQGDHGVLQQYVSSLGGTLLLDRDAQKRPRVSLYLPLHG